MISGQGYIVYVYSDDVPGGSGFPKLIDSDVSPRQETEFVYSDVNGNPVDGPGITVTDNEPTNDEGWNLLANPYFATIDFCDLTRGTGIGPTVEVWDPVNGDDGQSTDGYATYNCSGSNGSGSAGGAGDGLVDGHIAPHQSFFIKAETSGDLNLSIEDIVLDQTNSAGTFLKSEGEESPNLALQLRHEGRKYTTSIGFLEGASKGLDRSSDIADGFYIDGAEAASGMSLYSVLDDGTSIVTNMMPRDLSENQTIPLKVDACNYGSPLRGEATITWPQMRNLPSGWGFVLKDTKTNTLVDLSSASEYTFTLQSSCPKAATAKSKSNTGELVRPPSPQTVEHSVTKDGSGTRFQLLVKPGVALPVEFTSFTGSVADNAAKLEWTTATEQNNAGFQVQRKVDGSFQNIEGAFVEGAGTSEEPQSYSYRVEDLDAGQHTFRLKQVDVDGGSSFSKETTVEIGLDSQYELKAYPNPISEQATIKFAVKESQDVTLELYNTLGQRVQVLHQGSVPSSQTRTVSLQASDLSSGLYIVRMRGESFSTTKSVTVVR
jgi:hypothetical protein